MRLAIVAEGRTEEEFLKALIVEKLRNDGIEMRPILLNGNVSVERVAAEIARLSWSFDSVTSFVDYYGFKYKGGESPASLERAIDDKARAEIGKKHIKSKIFSYVQKYEFEGLLFSDPEALDRLYGDEYQFGAAVARVRSQFQSPEDINDDPSTAPSRRLAGAVPRYNKVLHGPLIAMEVGLSTIRSECPRFDAWVERLESLRDSG